MEAFGKRGNCTLKHRQDLLHVIGLPKISFTFYKKLGWTQTRDISDRHGFEVETEVDKFKMCPQTTDNMCPKNKGLLQDPGEEPQNG